MYLYMYIYIYIYIYYTYIYTYTYMYVYVYIHSADMMALTLRAFVTFSKTCGTLWVQRAASAPIRLSGFKQVAPHSSK